MRSARFFEPAHTDAALSPISLRLEKSFGERLAAVQQLREGRQALRLGWLWAAGTTTVTSPAGVRSRRRVFQPLVTRTVRVVRQLGSWELIPYGDPEITPLISDREVARRLEQRVETGGGAFTRFEDLSPRLLERLPRLRTFAHECAGAAGFSGAALSLGREQPEELMRHDGLRIVVGLAVYATDEPGRTTRAGSLLAWPDQKLLEPTAFHAVYAGLTGTPTSDGMSVEGPLPLTVRQAETVRTSRDHPLTVVSGAPGTGKSHTLVSIVCDSLRRRESVLVAAKNDAAVDALIDLLSRQPGITPVVFGSSERRSRLTQRLADGELRPAPADDVGRAANALDVAIEARDEAREAARLALRPEWLCTAGGLAELESARRIAPAAFSGGLEDIERDLRLCRTEPTGWWARRRRRAAERSIRRRTGAPADASLDAILRATRLGNTRHAIGEPTSTEACAQLHHRSQVVRQRLTEWLALETRSSDRLDRGGLAAVATLATALRSGRSARRVQLERLRDRTLTRALPVWIGTLGDVDDLLPPVAGLFDLVLIDEASSTDQTIAASSLLRARRAVVVGDPRQLRHVSFLSDATISEALDRHGVDVADMSQLDVRRNSLFDAAAAASAVLALDEHFRSAPHLIDVVASTIYGGALHVATRTPLSESTDCVHLAQTTGTRQQGGVVQAEINAIIAALRRCKGIERSVGIITPFRAQADAIEAAILASFDATELVAMGVRVGTVHSFQGNERDAVLCSLGLVDGDTSGWTFVSDPHLLAVMLTRARRSMTLISSCTPTGDSLLGRYVAAADSPPGPPAPAAPLSTWARSIVADLQLAGLHPYQAYPAGRHIVDVAVADRHRPIAIICDLHPDGIEAHIERHLALLDQGWEVITALRSEAEDGPPTIVLDLAERIRAAT